jgi:hypothetical protein
MKVTYSAQELQAFAKTWPCSGMRQASRPLTFEYDARGNLVDILGEDPSYSDSAVSALAAID